MGDIAKITTTNQFAEITPPTDQEVATAAYLLEIGERRQLPGGAANREYLRFASALEALMEAQAKLTPSLSSYQRMALMLRAFSSVTGTIFGTCLHPDEWHEEIEAMTNDIYLTARRQREYEAGS